MFRQFVIVASVIMFIVISHKTEAATVVYYEDSGIIFATGILGMSVGTDTYNVDFIRGDYDSEFGTGYDVPDQATAWSARNAIVTAFNINDPIPDRIAPIGYTWFLIPYDTNASSGNIICAQGSSDLPAGTPPWYADTDYHFPPTVNGMYARLEMVPIPGALWLLGSGLIGIVGIRRKFNK